MTLKSDDFIHEGSTPVASYNPDYFSKPPPPKAIILRSNVSTCEFGWQGKGLAQGGGGWEGGTETIHNKY